MTMDGWTNGEFSGFCAASKNSKIHVKNWDVDEKRREEKCQVQDHLKIAILGGFFFRPTKNCFVLPWAGIRKSGKTRK